MGLSINFRDLRGGLVILGKIFLFKGVIYEISYLRLGIWKLIIFGVGKYEYLIKGFSKINVDFEYFFVMILIYGSSIKLILILYFFLGECYLFCILYFDLLNL